MHMEQLPFLSSSWSQWHSRLTALRLPKLLFTARWKVRVDRLEQRWQGSKDESCSADQDADAKRLQKNHWTLKKTYQEGQKSSWRSSMLSPSHTLSSTFKTSLQTTKAFIDSLKSEHLKFLGSTQNHLKVIHATLDEQNFVLHYP